MSSILESEATFKAKALSHGLTDGEVNDLVARGVNSMSKLAFALTTPGVTPDEGSLRRLINDGDPGSVTLGTLSAIRRLVFEAQTLSIALVKSAVEGTEMAGKVELAPAERSHRIAAQKTRLQGVSFMGRYECSHSSYDVVGELLEKDSVVYPQPHKFGTRSSEVSKEKPPRELVIDGGSHISVKDGKRVDKCNIKTELDLSQAFTRRSLAFDLMGAATLGVMEKYHQFLLGYLQMLPPPGYSAVSMDQCLRADRAAWLRVSEKVTSIKKDTAGKCPIDDALVAIESDPAVLYHLLPCPLKQVPGPPRPGDKRKSGDDHDGEKGKGKGKGKGLKAPAAIKDLNHNTDAGKRICWNYNLKNKGCKFAKSGESCKRGVHCCMVCFGSHPQFDCKRDKA